MPVASISRGDIIIAVKKYGNCTICGKLLRGKQIKFCSRSCKNKDLQCYQKQQERGLTRKLKLIKDAGGKCSICGYAKKLPPLPSITQTLKGKALSLICVPFPTGLLNLCCWSAASAFWFAITATQNCITPNLR